MKFYSGLKNCIEAFVHFAIKIKRKSTRGNGISGKANFRSQYVESESKAFASAPFFNHIVIDNFLPENYAHKILREFPDIGSPIWLDWKRRSASQYGKQGIGNADKLYCISEKLRFILFEFNSSVFINYLEALTGIKGLIPDPHFSGGGMHQIVNGGILDVHTDFNKHEKLGLYRVLNILIYFNKSWNEDCGGCLELFNDNPMKGGQVFAKIPPLFNRAVAFRTDKKSFHGHPQQWMHPADLTRKSIALYYYVSRPLDQGLYDNKTDFVGLVSKTQL